MHLLHRRWQQYLQAGSPASAGAAEASSCENAVRAERSACAKQLPFGGVGNSGMGKYHGHSGFEAFTNARGVLYHSALIDPGVKYPPYSEHELERKVVQKLM